LRCALAELPERGRILEIGAGSGFQSAWLRDLGFEVSAVDVAEGGTDFPVLVYDGVHLPFDDKSFDVVFSSNVLEHVTNLPGLLADVRRVLTPGGRMIAVLPSSTWRLWTSLAHYPYLIKYLVTRRPPAPSRGRTATSPSSLSVGQKLRRAATSGPHGEFPTAAHELRTFRRRWWIDQLTRAGYRVVKARSLGLFYTGYSLRERASLSARRRASKVLGSSTYVLVAEPAAE